MVQLGRILTNKLESCRPKYTNKLITELNSLVPNPPLHTLYDNNGLRGDSTIFCGSKYKNKTICGDNKLSSKPDTGDSLPGCFNGTTKSSFTNLDNNTGVTTKRIINQVQENEVSTHTTVNEVLKMVK